VTPHSFIMQGFISITKTASNNYGNLLVNNWQFPKFTALIINNIFHKQP
jgi:hypothetical protein